MKTSRNDRTISRRAALAAGSAGGAAMLLAGMTSGASAQSGSLADHPLTGTWMVLANPLLQGEPQVPHIAQFNADGTMLSMAPPSYIGLDGTVFQTPMFGLWEAYDEQRGHFTATQILSDPDGNVVGAMTVDGYPLASADGQTFEDDNEMVQVTVRDASGAIVDSFSGAGGRPVRGNRLAVGNATFPDPLPDEAAWNS
jgi:hypothetical protein